MNGQPDGALKFGAGRIIMKAGLLDELGDELRLHGSKPYFVGGPTAMSIVRDRAAASMAKAGMEGVFSVHPGHVYREAAILKAEEARAAGCDVVVAVGGGRAMDFGKLVGDLAGTRTVCLPTSIATCAAYSNYSLLYTSEGKILPGKYFFPHENAAVLVDMEVIANAPLRLAISGILDAMGKYVEIKNGFTELPEAGCPMTLYAGYLLAKYSYEKLGQLAEQALADLRAHRVSQTLEDVTFLNIVVTGNINGYARGYGQTAIAHDLYYKARLLFHEETMPTLHGEIVGLGILPQLYYNGEPEKVEPFRGLLRRLGAPTCLSEIGMDVTESNFRALYEKMAESPRIGKDEASQKRLWEALQLIKA